MNVCALNYDMMITLNYTTQVVRLLSQSLHGLGYSGVASMLEQESGVQREQKEVTRLRSAVLEGRWNEALQVLKSLQLQHADVDAFKPTIVSSSFPSSSSSSVAPAAYDSKGINGYRKDATSPRKGSLSSVSLLLRATSHTHARESLCLDPPGLLEMVTRSVCEQQYLELLEAGEVTAAVGILRTHIAPAPSFLSSLMLETHAQHVQSLAKLVMFSEVSDLYEHARWDGARGNSRQRLLGEICEMLPSSVCLKPDRLLSLLDTAFASQVEQCIHHVPGKFMPLLSDHSCHELRFECVEVLKEHTDDVLFTSFSPCGTMLASAGADHTVVIWQRLIKHSSSSSSSSSCPSSGATDGGPEFVVLEKFKPHARDVWYLSWSPTGSHLLTVCDGEDHKDGGGSQARVWAVQRHENTNAAQCMMVMETAKHHTEPITACAWLPDGEQFVTGGLDKRVILWRLDGGVEAVFEVEERVLDMKVSSALGELCLVCITSEENILVFNLETKKTIFIEENAPLVSLSLSKDGRHAVVNTANPPEIRVWDIHKQARVAVYNGFAQNRYVVRSALGGPEESLLVSGSEDSRVYVWHRQTLEVMQILSGHTGHVSQVAFCPTDQHMFVSASDDATLRVFRSRKEAAQLQ
jgi:WD40 repeat protein